MIGLFSGVDMNSSIPISSKSPIILLNTLLATFSIIKKISIKNFQILSIHKLFKIFNKKYQTKISNLEIFIQLKIAVLL
jgi:hypothetical protein